MYVMPNIWKANSVIFSKLVGREEEVLQTIDSIDRILFYVCLRNLF